MIWKSLPGRRITLIIIRNTSLLEIVHFSLPWLWQTCLTWQFMPTDCYVCSCMGGGERGRGSPPLSPPQALLPHSLLFCFFSVRFRLWVVFPWDPVRIFRQSAFIHLSFHQHSAQKRCINTSFTVLCQVCVDAKVQNISVPVWGDLITETHARS